MIVPAGWTAHAATATSAANSAYLPTADEPTVDSFTSPAQDNGIIAVSATKMKAELTLKEWSVGTPRRIQLTLGCKPKGPTASTTGGVRAAVYTMPPSCGGTGWAGLDYVVARAGYGYDIQENSQPGQQAQHRAAFAQILTTFKFTR